MHACTLAHAYAPMQKQTHTHPTLTPSTHTHALTSLHMQVEHPSPSSWGDFTGTESDLPNKRFATDMLRSC